jgi:phage terminase large subunit-like protein
MTDLGELAFLSAFNGDVPDVQIEKPSLSFAEYVERTRRFRLDEWQVDLCARLEGAFRGVDSYSPTKTRSAIHAPPQYGKSVLISQSYPAYILGQNPTHRIRLATYSVMHSARFSRVIQTILRSPEHRTIFRDRSSWIPDRTKFNEWSTHARLKVNDGQSSFSALGLRSGFVGTGVDTLIIDDPYKSVEEALSDVINESIWRFWEETSRPRCGERTNVFIMFHRYRQNDMGGRAIASREFDLWRYAAEADGDFEDEETGLRFPDPIARSEGELLSPRFSREHVESLKKTRQVWNSQFQGRPTDKAGGFFDVAKIGYVTELPPLVHRVRAWDNASTEGAGAWTVGAGMGIDATGRVIVYDIKREQLNTADRRLLQETTAQEDGRLVTAHFPQDPGSAGKDVAFDTQQMLSDYHVVTEVVSGSKEMRAYPLSLGINRGDVSFLKHPTWNKIATDELKNFPLSTYKDQVDALSDGYRYLQKLFHQGLVLKGYDEQTHLLTWSAFEQKFGARKVPFGWDVQAAIRLENDASKHSGACIVARAGEGTGWEDVVFVLAATRQRGMSPDALAEWLTANIAKAARQGFSQILLPKDSWQAAEVLMQKYGLPVVEFKHDLAAGISELNWYMQIDERRAHHFLPRMGASRCYWLVDDEQRENPVDENGLLSLRQDAVTWTYNDKGEPQPQGGISLSCLKMIMYGFPLGWAGASPDEKIEQHLPEPMKRENVKEFLAENQMQGYLALRKKVQEIMEDENIEPPDDSYEGSRQRRSNFRNRFSRGRN